MNTINLHTYIPQTRTLGPFLRFAFWVQACPFRCYGCMTPAAQTETGGTLMPISELAEKILNTPSIEGLTITGGEPFAQATALVKLIQEVRQTKDLGIIVYSGYTLKKLQVLPEADKLLQHIDLLIDGTYVAALNDGGSLRGSSNQQVHALTSRYSNIINDNYGQKKRCVEVHLIKDDVMLVGVPGDETLRQWQTQFH